MRDYGLCDSGGNVLFREERRPGRLGRNIAAVIAAATMAACADYKGSDVLAAHIPAKYVGFGDSITSGDGNPDKSYLKILESKLRRYSGEANVINEGAPSTRSKRASKRIGDVLAAHGRVNLLILYGTNDWNDPACREPFRESGTLEGCRTVDNLRIVIEEAKAKGSYPILGTIPPVNEGYEPEGRTPPVRNAWVGETNKSLRKLAEEEGVPLADIYRAFTEDPRFARDPGLLLYDHVHPNPEGQELIADTFFGAITQQHGYASRGL
jgi:lysophospholipase L1-like esterase